MNETHAEVERLERLLEEVKKMAGIAGHHNSSVRIDAGAVGIWIISCLCCVMFGLNLLLFFVVIEHSRRMDDLNHYLQAVYQEAPHLKPKEKP